MEVVPPQVGVAARGWDEQSLDLAATSAQIRDAPTSGFTGPVAGVASRFAATWGRHAESLAGQCEAVADGLRLAIRDYVTSDEAQALPLLELASYVQEAR
ncbi:MAG: hypothetical protein M3237_16325 [Actinomycetota bacterium]|nr:hypothetical protein [Actinomycetota bacterium]